MLFHYLAGKENPMIPPDFCPSPYAIISEAIV